MINPLKKDEISIGVQDAIEESKEPNNDGWAFPYTNDFRKRFMSLLGFEFKALP